MKVLLALLLTYGTASPCKTKFDTTNGDFGLFFDGRLMHVYRVAGCIEVTAFQIEGSFAFASIELAPRGMPTIVIDTWLMHGDRERQRYVWAAKRYMSLGRGELVPGPRRFTPRGGGGRSR